MKFPQSCLPKSKKSNVLGSFACLAFVASALVAPSAQAIVLVSSRSDDRVVAFNDDGTLVGDFITAGSGGLDGPVGLRIHPVTGELLVSSNQSNQILRYNASTGAPLGVFASGATLNGPSDLRFGPGNDLYVANFGTTPLGGGSTVARFNAAGAPLADFATGLTNPTGVDFVAVGDVLVTNFDFNPTFIGGLSSIQRFTSAGVPVTTMADNNLYGPAGLTVVGTDVYAASLLGSVVGNPNVVRFNLTTNAFDTVVIPPVNDLNFPAGLLFLPNGDLLVSNAGSGEIVRFNPAGGGNYSYAGPFNPDGVGGFTGRLAEGSQMLYLTAAVGEVAVPEPTTGVLCGVSLAFGWVRRRFRRAAR